MATPKGGPGVSTPKNPYVSTPNRLNASPRPHTGVVGSKSLAHKSPAVKTPSSVSNHAHRVSISSHPTSTPLAAPAIHDELLNLNSPAAALIASIGNASLTPIPTSQDGLGITTGIIPQSIRDGMLSSKNPEVERLGRLEQVAKLLKTRTEGHGVTREGIERIAQIHGFTILWDEENLTIAGNSVDLEIIFDGLERNLVRDVQLRLNTSGSDEPQLQSPASTILKQHLIESKATHPPVEAWRSLKHFSNDLQYLSQLDYTDSSTNCFELMHNLYTTFRKIWDEEEKLVRDRTEFSHMCLGNVGRPCDNANGRLGITSQFWLNKHNYAALSDELEARLADHNNVWTARFTCEKGSPGIHDNYDWLDSSPLKTTMTTEDVFQEINIQKPNWSAAALASTMSNQQKDADVAMMLDGSTGSRPSTLDLLFVCQLDAEVMVPVNALTSLNAEYPMIDLDSQALLDYRQVLLKSTRAHYQEDADVTGRWAKPITFLEEQNQAVRSHSYSLHTNNAWIYPVDKLRFQHPKQYADAVPILRQYALLWSILRNTLGDASAFIPDGSKTATEPRNTRRKQAATRVLRSNKRAAQDQLENVIHSDIDKDAPLKIDLSIDLLTHVTKAKLNIVAPIADRMSMGQGGDFMHMTIEVGRNGSLDIPVLRGSRIMEEDRVRRIAVKVLSLSEDVSVLVEWLLHELKPSPP